ncbi:hypothetical protein CC86DRAFT_462054 [Ophiobolus disseminans]|uniref:Uncharacterized protein n=1 Tax=Ophiobolus disseminans TaxID=1469910 RepID=A0A6A7AKI5_9PLEO|nr:hypothetical protein CC86DRAFT_462054 [Ophiobolus disseminans]
MAYQHSPGNQYKTDYAYGYGHTSNSYAPRQKTHVAPFQNTARYPTKETMYDDEEADYIAPPEYSKSDYIAPHVHPKRKSRPKHHDRPSRRSDSDYICPPVDKSRDDYIHPEVDETPFPSTRPTEREAQHYRPSRRLSRNDELPGPSRRVSFTAEAPSLPRRPRESERAIPQGQKSNYQIMKDAGFNNKREFMRAHGLRTWEPEDYDIANDILEQYRDIDTQNRQRSSSGRRDHTSRSRSVEFQSYPPPARETLDIDDDDEEYASDSSMSSVPQHTSTSPARRRRHRSQSPDPRYPEHAPAPMYISRGRKQIAERHSSSHRTMPGHFPSPSISPSRSSRHPSLSTSPPSILRRAYPTRARRSSSAAVALRCTSSVSDSGSESDDSVLVLSREGSEFGEFGGGDAGSDIKVGEEAWMSDSVVGEGDESGEEVRRGGFVGGREY